MNERDTVEKRGVKKRRRWGFWVFVAVNVAGVILAFPLLTAVFPLLGIWWHTRSDENFNRHQHQSASHLSTNSAPAIRAGDPAHLDSERVADPSFSALTNHLKLIGNLKEEELNKMVAYQFGKQKPSQADPAQFDRDTAVFHKINRTIKMIDGKQAYCYEVDLVDQNGNHETQFDYFEKPDLDYERGIATMELVNSNPQLKKIYNAFARVIGEQAAAAEQAPSTPPAGEPDKASPK